MFDVIAFDADDTLWHNESFYHAAQAEFVQLVCKGRNAEHVKQKLFQTEMCNLESYGYGIKSFTLSMVEAALELTGGRIQGKKIQKILDIGKKMLKAEVQLLDYAEETVANLSQRYPLMIITKGDLFDQESKVARSGLAGYFKYVEILCEKTMDSYAAILAKHKIEPGRFAMVGNSLKSDILPVIDLGGWAFYVPHYLTWAHEVMPMPEKTHERFYEVAHLGLLPDIFTELNAPTQE